MALTYIVWSITCSKKLSLFSTFGHLKMKENVKKKRNKTLFLAQLDFLVSAHLLCICPPRICFLGPCSWAVPGSPWSSFQRSLHHRPRCRRPEKAKNFKIKNFTLSLSKRNVVKRCNWYLSIQSVSVDDKCVEWRVARKPNLLERPVLHEHSLQVGFAALLVQISKIWSSHYWYLFSFFRQV